MQKKLEQLEEKINEILFAIGRMIIALIHKIIPQSFFDRLNQVKSKIKEFIRFQLARLVSHLVNLKNNLLGKKDLVMGKVDQIQKFPLKEVMLNKLRAVREVLLKTPLKNHVQKLSDFLKRHLEKFNAFVDRVGRQQLSIAFAAMMMIGIGTYSVYDSTRDIYQKEQTSRAPASAQEYDEKPAYQMFERKTAVVLKVQVPVFRSESKEVRNVTIDFTVRTSTRFAKKYLEFHNQKLIDYFFTTVEPVTSNFPLEEEGKDVLKEKIMYEVNNFLRAENVEGHVEAVNIIYIVGY